MDRSSRPGRFPVAGDGGCEDLFFASGSPWENGYVQSSHDKLRDELLTVEVFDTLLEAKVLIERWRTEYNTISLHSFVGYRPPDSEAILPMSCCFDTRRNKAAANPETLT